MRLYTMLTLLLLIGCKTKSQNLTVSSPDNNLKVTVFTINKKIEWSLSYKGEALLSGCNIAMHLSNQTALGINPVVVRSNTQTINEKIISPVPVKNKVITDNYNELKITFQGDYDLIFRAYNDGVAYRFVTRLGNQRIQVLQEDVNFGLSNDLITYWPVETGNNANRNANFMSSYEYLFKPKRISSIKEGQYGGLPVLLSTPSGINLLITESDLHDYPNLFLSVSGRNKLQGIFPKVVTAVDARPRAGMVESISKKADFIASTTGNRAFPWRTIIVSKGSNGLIETDMVYKLASQQAIPSTDWVIPGKAAWDWWSTDKLKSINGGLNTETYKNYIDFAAKFGLEYIILDGGWAQEGSFNEALVKPNAKTDMKEVVSYAKQKKVGIILWMLWKTVDKNMDRNLDLLKDWGVDGIKLDFINRADQYIVNFYDRIAAAAAKRKMIVVFHGSYKPTGLNRKYPNVLSFEGVKGLENNKWGLEISPSHDLIIPFTRMVAGPMDYTPGAMRNAAANGFRIIKTQPMAQGTRAHQVAMYVVYESPLQTLADNPSSYLADTTCTRFICDIPTTWDRTVCLTSSIGEYIAVARKKNENWYIGAMNNSKERQLTIHLNFLDNRKYKIKMLTDPLKNSSNTSYLISERVIDKNELLKISIKQGGGWVAILTPM